MAQVSSEVVEGMHVVALLGVLGVEGVNQVRAAFLQAIDGRRYLVVDLARVELIASPGITLLVTAARGCNAAQGKLVVSGAVGMVDDVLRRCRLETVLSMMPSVAEAVRFLEARKNGSPS